MLLLEYVHSSEEGEFTSKENQQGSLETVDSCKSFEWMEMARHYQTIPLLAIISRYLIGHFVVFWNHATKKQRFQSELFQ